MYSVTINSLLRRLESIATFPFQVSLAKIFYETEGGFVLVSCEMVDLVGVLSKTI